MKQTSDPRFIRVTAHPPEHWAATVTVIGIGGRTVLAQERLAPGIVDCHAGVLQGAPRPPGPVGDLVHPSVVAHRISREEVGLWYVANDVEAIDAKRRPGYAPS